MQFPTSFELIIEKFIEESFISTESSHYKITNLGALLFAKDMRMFGELKYKLPRVITYSGDNKLSTVVKDQTGWRGYASGFEGLIDYIYSQIPEKEEITKIRTKQKNYPLVAVREFLANSLIHQDLTLGTKPMIEIYVDRIEISNGGNCLFDSERIIDHTPKSRNEMLAEKMRACYQHVCLNYEIGRQTTNESLRERFEISERSASMISRLIKKTMNKGLIKVFDPSNKSSKYSKYIPNYA